MRLVIRQELILFLIQLERVADKYSHVRINLWGKNTDHILYSNLKKNKAKLKNNYHTVQQSM